MLLWDEYKAQHPDGYQYSFFAELYRAYAKKLDICMRQVHLAGEKLFVDYCGQTVPVIDKSTGEVHNCQIFVAVLGASNFTYSARLRYSITVLLTMPQLLDMAFRLRPQDHLRRKTSLIVRMGILSLVIQISLKRIFGESGYTNFWNLPSGGLRFSEWSELTGMRGRIPPESGVGLKRNQGSDSSGMVGRDAPEYAHLASTSRNPPYSIRKF